MGHLMINLECPNWHYRLDMSCPRDAAIAEQLSSLNLWDMELDRRQRTDTSELGDQSHWRNVFHQGPWKPDVSRWALPREGRLDFDYVSARRPPSGSDAISQGYFEQLLELLSSFKEVEGLAKVEALRRSGHQLFLSCGQMRELLSILPWEEARLRAAVMLYFQVVDIQNETIFRVVFDTPKTLQRFRRSLGYLVTFPFIQPEGSFHLCLEQREKRVIAHLLAVLQGKERCSLQELVFCDISERKTSLPSLPKAWETAVEKVPTRGVISGRYVCVHEERNLPVRKQLLQQYGGWKVGHISKQNVCWWADCSDAPEGLLDVVQLYLRNRGFEALRAASWTSADFGPALAEWGVEDAEGIFQFLSCGQKAVSRREWSLLEDFAREVRQQAQDLVRCAARRFHLTDVLDQLWSKLGESDATLTPEEWKQALEERLGFYGPKGQAFRLMEETSGQLSAKQLVFLAPMLEQYLAVRAENAAPGQIRRGDVAAY
ncbi:unnamed protein product [Effrenium voratum]|nr:unnamed protein product [Effrenium voratum]